MLRKVFRSLLFLITLLLLIFLVWSAIHYRSDQPASVLRAQYAYPDSHFIKVKGEEVHYRETGTGPNLLLLHGTGASLHTWEALTKLLAKHFRVISVDLPAYGLSGARKDRDYSIPAYVNFLKAFTETIALDSFHLVGNSLGGNISWEFTLQYPESVNKLILIDASGYPKKSTQATPLAFRLAQNNWTASYLKKVTPKFLFEKSIADVYYQDSLIQQSTIDRYYDLFLLEGAREAFIDRLQSKRQDNSAQISSIRKPTLILWGKQDSWIPVANAYQFKRDISGAELIVYDNAGHIPMEEIPEITARDAQAFLLK